MGTINYGTSEYITIGVKPFDSDDFLDEFDNVDSYAMSAEYDDLFENIKSVLAEYTFGYFHVDIKPGYYEGFYIDIENNNPLCFDSWQDKREAQKEVTALKGFLLRCINLGLCWVWPGWCTSYKGYAESITGVKQAIKDMRTHIKSTPTWYTCERMGIEI